MDKKCIEIKRKDKTVLHAYLLQPGESPNDGLRLALEDACRKKISLAGADLSHKRITGAVINGLDLSHSDLSGAEFIACQANKINLSSINGKGLLISRTEMNNSNLSYAGLSHSTLHKSHIKNSEIGGANFNGALLNTVDLYGAKTYLHSSVNFDGAMLFKCNLENSVLDNPYFRFSRIIKSNLENSHLTLPKFHKSLVDDCAVRGFHMDGAYGSHIKIKRTDIKDIQISGIDNLRSLEVDGFVYSDSKNLTKISNDNWAPIPRIDYPDAQKQMHDAIAAKDQMTIDHLRASIPRTGKQFDMSCSDLSHMDLSGLQLKGIDFTGSDFTGATLAGSSLAKSTLDGCIFNAPAGKPLDFSDIKLNETSMRNTRFLHVNMEYSNTKDATLCFAYMKDVAMVKAEMSGVKMLCSYLDKQSLFNGSQLIGATMKSMELRGGSFAGANISEANLTSVHSSYTRFTKADFTHSLIKKSDFRGSDLSSLNMTATTLNEVFISHAKMQRLQAMGATMHSVSIEHAAMQGSDFSRASMKQGGMKSCNINGSNWEKAMVDSVSITQTNVNEARNAPNELLVCAGLKQDKAAEIHKPEPMPDDLKTLLQGLRSKRNVFEGPSI